MQAADTDAVATWCLAACRESVALRATFDELVEIVAASPALSVDDLDSIRRSFIRRISVGRTDLHRVRAGS